MNIGLQELFNNWWVIGLVCCAIPFVIVALFAVWLVRAAPRLMRADEESMRQGFARLRAQYPNATTSQLVQRIIARESLKSGLIGAITSVGGLPTLPIALPIDLITTVRIQSAMLQFIAWAYQPTAPANGESGSLIDLSEALALRMGVAPGDLILAGGQRLTRYATRQLLVHVVEKSFAKLIPGIGLIIGFAVNYSITRGMGVVAARWYEMRG
ncbi:MAG: hypothetical protein SF162_06245 [bacterium]|nr:hypothetical protein [bacterium]